MKKLWIYLLKYILGIGVVIFLLWCAVGAEVSPKHFILGIPTIARYLYSMVPPEGSILSEIGNPLGETFQIAVVSIVASVIIAIPLSFLGARNMAPNGFIYQVMRTVFGTLRGIPPYCMLCS